MKVSTLFISAALMLTGVQGFIPTPNGHQFQVAPPSQGRTRGEALMDGKSNAIRDRIGGVKNTKKITEAMRLVAAAKVRRAQDACISTRPFNEGIQGIFSGITAKLSDEDIDLPLLQERPAKKSYCCSNYWRSRTLWVL
jgi:hypothetical protein